MLRNTRAYSLIEVLIVVVITSFVISIAVPAMLKARERSRLKTCQENLVKLDDAVQRYVIDENFKDQADAVITLNSIGDLVGEGKYIRFLEECPSGGEYHFQLIGPAVRCDVVTPDGEGHYYPTGDVGGN